MAIKVQQVNVTAVLNDLNEAFSNKPLLTCSFCTKTMTMPAVSRNLCLKMSKPDRFFCRFCVQNNLTSKNSRHTLLMSFRSVFGYLYHTSYNIKSKKLYFNQLMDLVNSHQKIGLLNPAFKYDPESFLWFVDFEKVGTTGRKIPVVEVHKTVVNILACFNLYHNVPNFRMHKFYEKYSEAVDDFYSNRSRPESRRILCPTFQNCGPSDSKDFTLEKTREFVPQDMIF